MGYGGLIKGQQQFQEEGEEDPENNAGSLSKCTDFRRPEQCARVIFVGEVESDDPIERRVCLSRVGLEGMLESSLGGSERTACRLARDLRRRMVGEMRR